MKQKYRPPDLILFHHPHSILYRILPFPECPSDLFITPWLWESDISTARNSKESSAHLSDPVHLVPLLRSLCRPLQTQGPLLSCAPTAFCSHFSGPWTFLNIGDFCPFTENPTSSWYDIICNLAKAGIGIKYCILARIQESRNQPKHFKHRECNIIQETGCTDDGRAKKSHRC